MKFKDDKKEKTLIVGLDLPKSDIELDDSMDELEELVYAAGGKVETRLIQKKDRIDPAYYIGRGKALEIKNYSDQLDIPTIVFNDELSGAQIRNLEKVIGKKIVDRTNLILDIFANRASSKEGKLQVKLAQLQYRLPRLVGYRDYLSREGGGIGTRGPGEQKLETDRRHILREINNIKKTLKEIEAVRSIKRQRRKNSNIPIVALVGYTNAGKSTILNKLLEFNSENSKDKKVFVYDMLFATLDTTLRRGKLLNGQDFLVTDTVGFVSKLPTHLIEAFKGTLEELKYADLLLHVVDASSKDLDIQIDTTIRILKDLKVMDKPIITVFNKIDKLEEDFILYGSRSIDKKIYISAMENQNIENLLLLIQDNIPYIYREVRLKIPYDKQNLVDYFISNYDIDSLDYVGNGTEISLKINSVDYEKYKDFLI